MSGPARRAGGLYGGLHFSNPAAAPQSAVIAAEPVVQEPPKPEPAVAPPAAAPTTTPIDEANTKPSAAGWSASLAFAPTRRAPPKTKPRAPNTAAVVMAPPTAIVVEAAPVMLEEINANTPVSATGTGGGGGWGKKVKPPSMILDEDVNGFRAQAGGGGNKRNKKKKKQNQQQQYDPLEAYDPMRPNDYHEYKRFRAEVLARRAKRGRSESEEEWEDRERYGARMRRDEDDVPFPVSAPVDIGPAVQVDATMTGDEAYARRLAMSQGIAYQPSAPIPPPKSPSPPPHAGIGAGNESPPTGIGGGHDHHEYQNNRDDEDGWRPRFGLGADTAGPSHTPAFTLAHGSHTPAFAPAHEAAPTSSFVPMHEAPAADDDDDIDGEELHVGLGASPPPAHAPPHVPTFTPANPVDVDESIPGFSTSATHQPPPEPPAPAPAADVIAAARARAAEIAARLSKISAPAPPPQPEPAPEPEPEARPDPHGFAARLMARWGHVAGQGIGARPDEAIVVPLLVQATSDTAAGKGKKKHEEDARGKVGMGAAGKSAMGKIVNANENVGKEDIQRFGRPSRVVVLTNMVEAEEIEDEELRGDIGDECAKFGAVERVVPHLCGDGSVRVFVQYGGQPAAWKCVRELDGRFFAGRSVRARYFDEKRWSKGDLEWAWDATSAQA